jgi:hypothetical protein
VDSKVRRCLKTESFVIESKTSGHTQLSFQYAPTYVIPAYFKREPILEPSTAF